MHEAQMHRFSSFVTLTYAEENLDSLSLNYRDFQLFAKRARRKLGPFRFFVCGEYTKRWHPHFHVAMFGAHFEDRYQWRKSSSGFQLYRSAELEILWPHGNAEIGDLSFKAAGYIARYSLKKVTGDAAKEHYTVVDDRSGEIQQVEPEFCRMSLRPGIGSRWFDKFRADVFPRDYVVVEGRKLPVPRYYQQLLDRHEEYAVFAQDVETSRELKALELEVPEDRLRAMEAVEKARLSFKQRM